MFTKSDGRLEWMQIITSCCELCKSYTYCSLDNIPYQWGCNQILREGLRIRHISAKSPSRLISWVRKGTLQRPSWYSLVTQFLYAVLNGQGEWVPFRDEADVTAQKVTIISLVVGGPPIRLQREHQRCVLQRLGEVYMCRHWRCHSLTTIWGLGHTKAFHSQFLLHETLLNKRII